MDRNRVRQDSHQVLMSMCAAGTSPSRDWEGEWEGAEQPAVVLSQEVSLLEHFDSRM